MEADLYWYRAAPVRVVDGDTVVVEVDLGMRTRTEISCRVAGINTPEINSGTDRERGKQARDFTVAWTNAVTTRHAVRWPYLIQTHKDTKTFDRYVADIYAADTGESLADALRAAGW